METFKEKARELIFDSSLREFPVVFELYARTFGLSLTHLDETMSDVVSIIRNSENKQQAMRLVWKFLDEQESRV